MGHMEYSDEAIEAIRAEERGKILKEYREHTRMTGAISRTACDDLMRADPARALIMLKVFYNTVGLASETGEVANKIKKILRDNKGVIDDEVKARLIGELGGVCWYLDALCDELGFTLGEVLAYNRSQLVDRFQRGVIQGDGDDR